MIPSFLSMTDFVLAQISKLETGKTVENLVYQPLRGRLTLSSETLMLCTSSKLSYRFIGIDA